MRGEVEDTGGLPPVKDDNEHAILNCSLIKSTYFYIIFLCLLTLWMGRQITTCDLILALLWL